MVRSGGVALMPARFLLLLAHFVAAVSCFFDRSQYVRACDAKSTANDSRRDDGFLAALILIMICFGIESYTFFTGISMFNNISSLLSVVAHAAGSLAFSFFILETLCSDNIWYIFAFCSLLPAMYEGFLLYLVKVRKLDT